MAFNAPKAIGTIRFLAPVFTSGDGCQVDFHRELNIVEQEVESYLEQRHDSLLAQSSNGLDEGIVVRRKKCYSFSSSRQIKREVYICVSYLLS